MTDVARTCPALRCRFERRALILVLVIAILLLGTAVRFHRLGAQSLWYDEGLAYGHSLRTLPELLSHLQTNVHVPAYFAVLGWWQDFTGSSEFALRMLSALFSVLGVAWTYALGARLFHPIAGLAAAALVALNSFSIYYAQEARMYAMLTTIAAGSMWLFVDLQRLRSSGENQRRDTWLKIIGLGLINALGVYTHFAQALVIITQGALVALRFCAALIGDRVAVRWTPLPWQHWFKVMLAQVLALILFAPWLPVAIAQLGNRSHRLQHLPVDQMLGEILGFFAVGSVYELSMSNITFVIVFFLLLGLLPSASRRPDWWNALLPIAWVALSIAVFLFVGLGDGFLRFLLPAQLALSLWLGRGVWVLWQLPIRQGPSFLHAIPKLAAALALAAYLLTLFRGLDPLYRHPDFQRDDMRGLAQQIEAGLRPDDAVIVSAPGLQELLRYYYKADAPVYPLPTAGDDDTTRAQVLDIIAAYDRLHVIFYGAEQQDPNLIVERTLNRNAFEFADRWIDDLRYALYVGPPTFGERRRLDVDFGGEIALDSYALGATLVSPGDVLQAQFVWRALTKPSGRYKVFLQLLNSEGALVAQRDSEPAGGSLATTTWGAGDSIVDNHGLLIPADTPEGEYRLIAGLYDIDDPSARLIVDESSYLDLGVIEVNGAS